MDWVWTCLLLLTDPMTWVVLIGALIALNLLISAITKVRFPNRRRF